MQHGRQLSTAVCIAQLIQLQEVHTIWGNVPGGEGPVCKAWECAFRDHTVCRYGLWIMTWRCIIIMCREKFFGCVVSCKIFVVFACCER